MSLIDRMSLLVGTLFLSVVSSAGGTEVERYSVTMPDDPPLTFVQPAGWSIATKEAGPSVSVELSPADSGDFVMLITIFPFDPESPVASPDGLRKTVFDAGNRQLSGALQESIELTEVRGDGAIGYLYHLTDRSPERGPGDYREAAQGMMLFTPYVATVTVLTHSDDTSTVEKAMDLLESIEVESEP